jgi:hypothetical protein
MSSGRTWKSGLCGSVVVLALVMSAGAAVPMLDEEVTGLAVLPPLSSAADRGMLLVNMSRPKPARCYVPNPTPEQQAEMNREFAMLPPSLIYANGGVVPRFILGDAWNDNGFGGLTTGNIGTGQPVALTFSFPIDGVSWDGGNNNLNAVLAARFGAANVDQGREYIRQGLACWRRWTGLTYTEIADDNQPFNYGSTRVATRGDIRIGSRPQGTGGGVLAYNYFPGGGGGDMVINSTFFPSNNSGTLSDSSNSFRALRNVIAHEHGHGLGFEHTTPCNNSKLMEPQLSTSFEMLTTDEIRGGHRNYGDRFTGNFNGATAKDVGDLSLPTVRSFIAPNLSTNGAGTAQGEDWFKFTLTTAQSMTISVSPAGGSYQNAAQTGGCNPTTGPVVNASSAGNLNLELRNGVDGATVLQTASANGPGLGETISTGVLSPGTYWVRVVDIGPNDVANQFVQLYTLMMRVGVSRGAPVAIAGVNKRCAADSACFFMGDLNSYTTDVGAPTNSITTYEWDLDGDGTFEVANNARPTFQYVSNGSHTATLRVTDTNGNKGTDSISVVVFGATTALTGVSPSSSSTSATVPVTITGKNFKGVTSSGQVQVSGTGVTVNGTPVINPMGTQITGLSFVVSGTAAQTSRNVTVTNSDGQGGTATLNNAFTVQNISGACCSGTICSISNPATCALDEGVYQGDFTTCVPSPCGVSTGACCAADGSCTVVAQASCAGSWTVGGTCMPNICPLPSIACCFASGVCTSVTNPACVLAGGTPGAVGTGCSPNICPQPTGSCCVTDGSCSVVIESSCAGVWTSGGTCSPNTCPQPSGSCCATNGACSVVTQANCSGAWTNGGTCSPNACPQPTGVCCSGATCSITTQAACTGANTRWSGAASQCNASGNYMAPCCKADFDQGGNLSIDDIFIFLNAWFANSPQAAITSGGGSLTIDDIFVFLNAWFAGCP